MRRWRFLPSAMVGSRAHPVRLWTVESQRRDAHGGRRRRRKSDLSGKGSHGPHAAGARAARGSALGAYEAGVVRGLCAREDQAGCGDGVSIGAVNAAVFAEARAAREPLDDLWHRWRSWTSLVPPVARRPRARQPGHVYSPARALAQAVGGGRRAIPPLAQDAGGTVISTGSAPATAAVAVSAVDVSPASGRYSRTGPGGLVAGAHPRQRSCRRVPHDHDRRPGVLG
jgi:hypothetical protein